MKRSCYVSKVKDKSLVKVIKFNEDLNVTKDLREMKASIRDYFDTRKIHVQTVLVNNKVKIFNFSFEEIVFFEINIKLNVS